MLCIFFAKSIASHNNFNRVTFFLLFFDFILIFRFRFFIALIKCRLRVVYFFFFFIFLIHSHKLIIILICASLLIRFFFIRLGLDSNVITFNFIWKNGCVFLAYCSCSGRPVWALRVRLFSFVFRISQIFFKKIFNFCQIFRNKPWSVLMFSDTFFWNNSFQKFFVFQVT